MSDDQGFELIKVSDLILDSENPRFFHLRDKSNKPLTQEQMEDELKRNDEDLPALTKAIRKSGVKDPIWVIKRGTKYVVVEGNRRTLVLRELQQQVKQKKLVPPSGVSYDSIKAHILPAATSDTEVLLQKARLQTGKKAWGSFNEAAVVYQLREPPHLMEYEDIGAELKIPVKKVKERIENYKLFHEYVQTTEDDNPKRFSFFAEWPPKVRDWATENSQNKAKYFDLINPGSPNNKIKSVATRGGLRDFAKVLEDPEALKELLTDPTVTIDDAIDIVRDNDVKKALPFVRRIAPLALELRSLEEIQLEKLKLEPKVRTDLKSLRAACDEVIKKIEA